MGESFWAWAARVGLEVPHAQHRRRIPHQACASRARQAGGGGRLDGDACSEAQGRLHGKIWIQAGCKSILGVGRREWGRNC